MYGFWGRACFILLTSRDRLTSPFVCQSIVATGIRWANFYFGSLVLSGINIAMIFFAFRPTEKELQHDSVHIFARAPMALPPSPTEAATVGSEKAASSEAETSPSDTAVNAQAKSGVWKWFLRRLRKNIYTAYQRTVLPCASRRCGRQPSSRFCIVGGAHPCTRVWTGRVLTHPL